MARRGNRLSATAPDQWSTSATAPLLSDIGVAATDEEKTSPTGPSASATPPLSPEYEKHEYLAEIEVTAVPKVEKMTLNVVIPTSPTLPASPTSPISPTSPNFQLSSASVPLLSETEKTESDQEGKIPDASKEEKKKSFSNAANKIAFSHFLVIRDWTAFRSTLTDIAEDLYIFDTE